jgi:hypothetical protein
MSNDLKFELKLKQLQQFLFELEAKESVILTVTAELTSEEESEDEGEEALEGEDDPMAEVEEEVAKYLKSLNIDPKHYVNPLNKTKTLLWIDWNTLDFKKFNGKEKLRCPSCDDTRSDKRDKSLVINHDGGYGKCFYCESLTFKENISKIADSSYTMPSQDWCNYTNKQYDEKVHCHAHIARLIQKYQLDLFRLILIQLRIIDLTIFLIRLFLLIN